MNSEEIVAAFIKEKGLEHHVWMKKLLHEVVSRCLAGLP